DPEDLALIQFTSGSTSAPRGCALSHRAVLANLTAIMERFQVQQGLRGVLWLPLYHDMGLISGVFLPISAAATAVLIGPERFLMDPLVWLEALHRHRGVLTATPTFGMAYVTRRLRGRDMHLDLSAVRGICVGAEPVDPNVVRAFLDAMAPFQLSPEAIAPSYGLAENTLLVSQSAKGMRVERVSRRSLETQKRADIATEDATDSVEVVKLGKPISGAELRIVNDAGQVLPQRAVGEVELRSPSTMSEYFDDPQATASAFRDGWLRTGDIGYLANGELHLIGRAKDIIIVAGRNIAPQDIERLAGNVEGVRPGGVAAFGVNADGTEQIVVLIEARPTQDTRALPQAVRQACADGLGIKPAILRIVPPGSLPKTSSGKLQRSAARDAYLNGSLASTEAGGAA
ncbi:MAG TPA: AMP-binding protein, partial [Polyangiaceae bacterium]|nr:AMP-binding protein [Polyangiaceae bacterium]